MLTCQANRPVEGHSGARETILVGPYYNIIPNSEGAEIETKGGVIC